MVRNCDDDLTKIYINKFWCEHQCEIGSARVRRRCKFVAAYDTHALERDQSHISQWKMQVVSPLL